MISICIPVYNFNVTLLVTELANQMNLLKTACELIVIDDGSQNDEFKRINRAVCSTHTYVELEENIGRTRIRNLFLDYAEHDYLLFLDCDCLVESDAFLLNYIKVIQEKPSVVCGGRIYHASKPKREKRLSWKYGILRESKPYTVRRESPNRSFMTNNFLINKQVLKENPFDERIVKYGHEDTLFGYSLERKRIKISHIENPVINGDIELNREFLYKTHQGVLNLITILEFTTYKEDLIAHISLLRFYKKVRKIDSLVYLSYVLAKPFIVFLLSRGYVNLYLFDYYKLGILIKNLQKPTHKELYKELQAQE